MVYVHTAAADAVSVPAAAAIAAAAARDAARAYPPPTDEPSLAVSPKKPPRSLFLAAYSSRLLEVCISTYECRASFGMPTRGMVEVSADAHLWMTPF